MILTFLSTNFQTCISKCTFPKILIVAVSGIGVGYFAYKYLYPVHDDDVKDTPKTSKSPKKICTPKKTKVLVLGLQGCGKTSLLCSLSKQPILDSPTPTQGFNVKHIQHEENFLDLWEVGGSENFRQFWSKFYADSDVLVYVCDISADNLTDDAEMLATLTFDETLKQLPLIVVLNKTDLSDRLNVTELISVLDGEDGLKHHRTQNMLHTVCTSNAPQQPHSGIHSLESLLQKLLA